MIPRRGRDFIARHGETVFNAAGRLQGDHPHTPLTRAGFLQADEMGEALQHALGDKPALTLWASPTGRALQTLAVMAEHVGLDWHQARTDSRLTEIGMGSWGGRYYRDVIAEVGDVIDRPSGLLIQALAHAKLGHEREASELVVRAEKKIVVAGRYNRRATATTVNDWQSWLEEVGARALLAEAKQTANARKPKSK
jgi:hypothetical protein